MKNLVYRLKNWRSELHMLLIRMGVAITHTFGLLSCYGTLYARVLHADGSFTDYGAVGMRVVTDAGVAFLVDDWDDDTTDITTMNYHDSGTGGTAEAAGDTVLVTQAGPTTRATGTKSQPSANVLRSIGTIAYVSTLAITEHGLFNQAAQGGTLWDRTLFSVINVINGDSIQFTYDCTLTAGS
jgi:hypothetical protein